MERNEMIQASELRIDDVVKLDDGNEYTVIAVDSAPGLSYMGVYMHEAEGEFSFRVDESVNLVWRYSL